MWVILGIVALVVVVVLLWLAGAYNSLVALQNRFKTAFSQIDVQLKRRHDLIPNLVETAKGYLAHERGTLEAVTQARTAAMTGLSAAQQNPGDPAAMKQLADSQGQLAGALGRLNVAVEAYPDLKASQNMMQLSEELTSTENRVSFARQAYNDSIMSYNNRRESFPGSVIAGTFNFGPAAQWVIAPDHPETREAPKVQF